MPEREGADLNALSDLCTPWCVRCAEAARPTGRVIVLKGVGPDDSPRGLSIEMVLLGGKHRTMAEFRELAREAGLKVLTAERQPSGYFVVECLRPDAYAISQGVVDVASRRPETMKTRS